MRSSGPSYSIIVDTLKQGGISFIVHLPDKLLLPLVEMLDSDHNFRCVLVTREEEGVGIAAGAFLGGKKTALLMQSTGLGNSVNALTSLNVAYQIPLLILITLRGGLFEYNPADVPSGRALCRILEIIGIPYYQPSNLSELRNMIQGATILCETSANPVAVGLRPEVLAMTN